MFVKIAWSKIYLKQEEPVQHNGRSLRKISKEIRANIFAMPFVSIPLNSPNNSVERRLSKIILGY